MKKPILVCISDFADCNDTTANYTWTDSYPYAAISGLRTSSAISFD